MNIDQYERTGLTAYAAFSAEVAKILRASINAENGYRLQQVKERAKEPTSLRKKLDAKDITDTTTLEDKIKDLAGCRVIFYTDNDVTRFSNSGIIQKNFEVLEFKIHHPKREIEDASELYISNHYIVNLRPERVHLPEYASFAGMRCEIQIQSILHHAWAEMAHDTIYKMPALSGFGGKGLDNIKSRMRKVARKYLIPAGYEFQKIASDFQRLIEGKALFDGDALEAIVEAKDNNIRFDLLEKFTEYVLPSYDNLQKIYPEIVEKLLAAADRARSTLPTVIETPYGGLPAKTDNDIVHGIVRILTRYRYLDVSATFDALLTLYSSAEVEEERKLLLALGKDLAKDQLYAWRQQDPIVQFILVDHIEALDANKRRELWPLLIGMLIEMLRVEVGGETYTSTTMTFHRQAVVASDELSDIRKKVIALMKSLFVLAESDSERSTILLGFQAATRPPIGMGYTNALARLIMENACAVIKFEIEIAPTLSLELLQTVEVQVHHCFRMYEALPQWMHNDPDLVKLREQVEIAALAFRDVANANAEFVIYKTLVGFNSIFPPAWKDKKFQYQEAKAYRLEQVKALLDSVNEASKEIWLTRINRYACTKSNDAATFPVFGKFLEQLAEVQPEIVLSYIGQFEEPLTNFLHCILSGLMRSTERAQALKQIESWLSTGKHLRHIAWHLQFAEPFDERLLCCVRDSAHAHSDTDTMRDVLHAAVRQFTTHPGTLIEQIFLPALNYLKNLNDFSWVDMPWFSWLNSPIIQALNEEQAASVLAALIYYPKLEGDAEYIAATIAKNWPARVITFLGDRQTLAQSKDVPQKYAALPFMIYELQVPLAAVSDLLLKGARAWFESWPMHFPYDGGRLIASVFPDLSNELKERLVALIASRDEADLRFVLGILSAFEGKACIYECVRAIVATLDPESPLLSQARSVLDESGVVRSEFGFADLYAKRKALLEPWLSDASEAVQKFAHERIYILDQSIAKETRAAETGIALRKLEYGEELN